MGDDELRIMRMRLKKLRMKHERNTPMKVLSELMGLHSDALRRYETGEDVPSANSIIKIALYYNVSCDYIMGIGVDEK